MQSSLSDFCGATYRRSGGLRSVALSGQVQTDQMLGMAEAVEEAIDGAFGKMTLDEQLEADRRAYEPRPLR